MSVFEEVVVLGLSGETTRESTLGGKSVVGVGGFVIMGLATVPFALSDGATNEWWLMATLLVRGFGMGAVMIPVMSVAFVGLDRSDVPHASILTRITQQIGGSFGVALLAVILEGAVTAGHGAAAFDQAFWWAVGFTAVAVVVSFALPKVQKATT